MLRPQIRGRFILHVGTLARINLARNLKKNEMQLVSSRRNNLPAEVLKAPQHYSTISEKKGIINVQVYTPKHHEPFPDYHITIEYINKSFFFSCTDPASVIYLYIFVYLYVYLCM